MIGEVVVFKDDVKGYGCRPECSGRFVVRDLNRYDLAPGEEPGSAGELSVDGHTPVCYEARCLSPGDRHLVGEEPIQALGFRTDNSQFDFASRICLRPGA